MSRGRLWFSSAEVLEVARISALDDELVYHDAQDSGIIQPVLSTER